MRKHNNRRVVTPRVPMLVVMHTIPDLSLTERLSAEAFAGGWAGTDHYDNLADCRDMLALAGETDASEMAYVALANIRDRHAKTGKFGATGDELQALWALVDFSEDFWKRQGGAVFEKTYRELKAARAEQKGQAA